MLNKFSERLKSARTKCGISQKKLAEKLFVSQQTIAKWETDKATPNPETITKIADLLNASLDFLLGRTDNNATLFSSHKGIKIPVIGNVAAGIPIDAIEEILDYEEIDEETASLGTFFGLKIKGSSMEPRIKEGDVVIVRQQPEIESGDIAIVRVNGDTATCKKVMLSDNGITLIPFNPNYEPTFYSAEQVQSLPVVIVGKVVELRGKF